MKLGTKIFATSMLVVVVLLAVGALSLGAIDRLMRANAKITTRAVPALRLTSSLRDALLSLVRLEGRLLVLGDARYATLLDERAQQADAQMARLGEIVGTAQERALYREAVTAWRRYRDAVDRERTLLEAGRRSEALGVSEAEARPIAERVEATLDRLMEATQGAVVDAQATAARLEHQAWTGVLVAVVAAVLLAGVGTAVVAQRITRSLRRLSAATSAVGAGSLRHPITVDGDDEIADLGRAFNAMVGELRQMDEVKEELFARISHELRSPLTSVREAAHLLGESVAGPLTAKQARLVAIIGESSDRLLRLVNQILEVSRLRAGAAPLEQRRVELDRVVNRAVEELRPQAEEAGLVLAREQTGKDFALMGDEHRLLQVVVNLVGNAIRFTPRGGRVIVRVADARSEVEVQVEDSGVGIPQSALRHIFDSYRQAHPDRGGTGLGLAIARGIVQAHGGRITVESQEGKGTRFTVLLPRTREES